MNGKIRANRGLSYVLVHAGLFTAVFLSASGCAPNERTNVLVVVIDTLRADMLGCYGSPRQATPNLDAFAGEGVLFYSAYSQSPWTLPSFASLITSTYPSQHGAVGRMEGMFYPIRKRMRKAPQSFEDQGYTTAAVVNNIFLRGVFGFNDGFGSYDFYPAEIKKIRRADEVTGLAIRWLNHHEKEDKPFFLLLHYFDPHFAYLPPPEFRERFGGSFKGRVMDVKHPDDVREGKVLMTGMDKENMHNLYCGEVAFTDREVGRLMDHLREEGILENTVVVVTSDHGEELWDHGGFEHGHTQYEELLRVPLLVRFPGKEYAGIGVRDPVRLMDVMPFLHDYLGLARPDTFEGQSFLTLLRGEDAQRDGGGTGYAPSLFFEGCLYGSEKKAIRVNNLKLIMDMETKETWLFDLEKDPLEKCNLAVSSKEEAAALKQELMNLLSGLKRAGETGGRPADLSDETMEDLRKLGYTR